MCLLREVSNLRIMVFCSNPINGGTARMFYESVIGLMSSGVDGIYPCINTDNDVEIYKKIDGLIRLPIYSEQEICGRHTGEHIIGRIISKIYRYFRYIRIQKNNVKVIRKYIKARHIDCVIIHNGGYVGDDLCNQVLLAAYKEKISKRIYVLHNDMEKNFFLKLRYIWYDNLLDKCATNLVTVSKYTRDRIKRSSFIKRDICVVYNGIKIDHCLRNDEATREIAINPVYKNVLLIANFSRNKGHNHFINVAKKLLEFSKSYRFTIIGNVYDVEFYEECIELIDKYGLENYISIYSGINNAHEFIKAIDVLLVTTMYDESFGLISVEAMESGKPIVAFACGGVPEVVIDKRNGYVVPIGDDGKMADAVNALVTNSQLYENMSETNIKDFKERFSRESMVEQYLRIMSS